MANQKPYKHRHFHVPGKDREYFTTNLALLLKAAVPIGEALSSLNETTKSPALKGAILQIQHDIDEGLPIWKALDQSGIVSPQTMVLVKLGEQSGNLIPNLLIAAQQEEKQRMFRAKVRSALLYPAFVLGMTVVVGLGVAWFLLPRLSETFSQLRVDLPFISKVMIDFGIFLKANGLWAVPAILGGLGLLMYIVFAAPKTRRIGQAILMHIPGVSRLMHEVEIARFGYLFGTLLEAGLTVTQSLELLEEATIIPTYKKLYRHMKNSFEDGFSFKNSLAQYKHSANLLPPSVQQMIIAAERSGALPETLRNIGELYQEKSDISTKNLATILEPILLFIVWIGVLLVAVAVIVPIYGLLGGVGVQ